MINEKTAGVARWMGKEWNMLQTIKVGLVVSDEGEFAPITEYLPQGGARECGDWRGYRSVLLSSQEGSIRFEMRVVLCGIGLSNAAAATAFLIADGADFICNEGLSGALQGLSRGELVVGTGFVQHDFDATALGYEQGQVCGQTTVLPVFGELTAGFCSMHPEFKTGLLASGDAFICSKEKKGELCERYGALACDMESSAIALTCLRSQIPFLVVRQAADDAGDGAADVYREINACLDEGVIALLFDSLRRLCCA